MAESKPSFMRSHAREIRYLVIFVVLLGGGFTLLSLRPVNDHLVVPFTAGIAWVSAKVLNLLGQGITLDGVRILGERFSVEILNGCNGVEAMIIFLAAVLAFPAPLKARLAGLAIGIAAIQVVNLIRVVALYLTGAYFPALFNSSHTVIWQSIVIIFAVLLFLWWADRFAAPPAPAAATAAD